MPTAARGTMTQPYTGSSSVLPAAYAALNLDEVGKLWMSLMTDRLAKKHARFAILRVFLHQPLVKLLVVRLALVASVVRGVIAEVKLSPPAVATIGAGAMRRE